MSFPNSSSPSLSPEELRSYSVGSDAIGVWPQFSMSNEQQCDRLLQFDQQPPFKRPRNYEDNESNSATCPYPPMNPIMNPTMNPPIIKGITNIFFKTRLCAKFKHGACRNGENCNFAHGLEDLRQPPPNWQELVGGGVGRVEEDRSSAGTWDDDQKIILKMKLCKKFYNGEECPYGDRCNFLHEDPAKFRDDSGRYRESSAISIGTTGSPAVPGTCSNQSEGNRPVVSSNGINIKPVYWKTKLCIKWTLGQCPFGEKCHFAHGQAELQVIGGRVEGEAGNPGFIPVKPQLVPANDSSPTAVLPTLNKEGQGKQCLLKWKGPKKINRIYADWLDDMPLSHNLPNQVES